MGKLTTGVAVAFLAMGVSAPATGLDMGELLEDDEAREVLHGEIRDYLLSNPEILLEMLEIIQEKEELAKEDRDRRLIAEYRDEIMDDGVSYVGGNPEGDVTLVEFLDYQCGYCRRAHPEVASLLEEDGNIRWVVKEYPVLGPDSEYAARMAVATLISYGGDAYRAVHDALMTHQSAFDLYAISDIAAAAGLDFSVIENAMADPRVDDHIARVRELGRVLDVRGTPTFILGGTFVRGYVPKADLQRLVSAARAGEL